MTDTIIETGPIWNDWSADDIRTQFGKLSSVIQDIHHHQMSDEYIDPRSDDQGEQLAELQDLAHRLVIAGAAAIAAIPNIQRAAENRRWMLTAPDEALQNWYRGLNYDPTDVDNEQKRMDLEDEWERRGYSLDRFHPDDIDE